MLSRQSETWAFTIQNPTKAVKKHLQSIPLSDCFLIYGNEVAPTTGTPHLQGFVEFDYRRRGSAVLKFLCASHVEATRSSVQSNVLYCAKEGKFWCNDPDLLHSLQVTKDYPIPEGWANEKEAIYFCRAGSKNLEDWNFMWNNIIKRENFFRDRLNKKFYLK